MKVAELWVGAMENNKWVIIIIIVMAMAVGVVAVGVCSGGGGCDDGSGMAAK